MLLAYCLYQKPTGPHKGGCDEKPQIQHFHSTPSVLGCSDWTLGMEADVTRAQSNSR